MTQLTEHFSLEEMTRSDTAVRMGFDQTPPEVVKGSLLVTALGAERARSILGHPLLISSGYRCEDLERVLTAKDYASWCTRRGKDPHSPLSWAAHFQTKAHPRGEAIDFTCPSFGTPLEIVRALEASDLQFDQLIQEGTWVHLAFSPAGRRQVLTAAFTPTGTIYTLGS